MTNVLSGGTDVGPDVEIETAGRADARSSASADAATSELPSAEDVIAAHRIYIDDVRSNCPLTQQFTCTCAYTFTYTYADTITNFMVLLSLSLL